MRHPRRILLLALVALLGLQTVASAEPSKPEDNLGPNGEVPVDTVTDETIRAVADATGMSLQDARFAVGDGSRVIVDFIEKHQADPDFGELRVLNEGRFQPQLRTVTADSKLPDMLQQQLGRAVDHFVGGLSSTDLQKRISQVTDALSGTGGVDRDVSYLTTDFETGNVIVALSEKRDDLQTTLRKSGIDDVTFIVDTADITPTSIGGATLYNPGAGCTLGYVAREVSSSNLGFVTAAHCQDAPGWAMWWGPSGAYLGSFESTELGGYERCDVYDRQLHRFIAESNTTAMNMGFYDFFGDWASIRNVAGGYYTGQVAYRLGRYTKELSIVGERRYLEEVPGEGSDCPDPYWVTGLWLSVGLGQAAIPGDSGGPVYFLYNEMWYLAGTTVGISGEPGEPGNQTFFAWRSVPTGWQACTVVTPCP